MRIRVVVLAAAHVACGKPRAKLHALYGGDAKERIGKPVFDAIEHRVAETRRKSDRRAFDHTADGIPRVRRYENLFLHLATARIVKHGKLLFRDLLKQRLRGMQRKRPVRNARDGQIDARRRRHSFARESALRCRPRCKEARSACRKSARRRAYPPYPPT